MDLVQQFPGMPLDEELDYRIGNSHSNLTTARVHLHSRVSVWWENLVPTFVTVVKHQPKAAAHDKWRRHQRRTA